MIDRAQLWIPKCPDCCALAIGTEETVPAVVRTEGVTSHGEVLWTTDVELDTLR